MFCSSHLHPSCLQEASAKGRKALLAAIALDEGSSSEEEDSDEELDEVEDSTQDGHGVDCCHSEVGHTDRHICVWSCCNWGKGCLLPAAKRFVTDGHSAACCHAEATSLLVVMWFVKVGMRWVAARCRRAQRALESARTAEETVDCCVTQRQGLCVPFYQGPHQPRQHAGAAVRPLRPLLGVVTLALQPTVFSVWLQANESEGEAVPPQKPNARKASARKASARKRSTRPQPSNKRARPAEPARLDGSGEIVLHDAALQDPEFLIRAGAAAG